MRLFIHNHETPKFHFTTNVRDCIKTHLAHHTSLPCGKIFHSKDMKEVQFLKKKKQKTVFEDLKY